MSMMNSDNYDLILSALRSASRSNDNPISLYHKTDPDNVWLTIAGTELRPSSTLSPPPAGTLASFCVDWKETHQAHVFNAELPGIKKEDVKVEVENGKFLQISSKRTKESEEMTDKWHRAERRSGKLMRRFKLSDDAKVDEIKAAVENGVLTVTVPKEESKKPDLIAIEISG